MKRTLEELRRDYPVGARVFFKDTKSRLDGVHGVVTEIDQGGVPIVDFGEGNNYWRTSLLNDYPDWTLTVVDKPQSSHLAVGLGVWGVSHEI